MRPVEGELLQEVTKEQEEFLLCEGLTDTDPTPCNNKCGEKRIVSLWICVLYSLISHSQNSTNPITSQI